MRITKNMLGVVLGATLATRAPSAADMTVTGVVGDAICGRAHMKAEAEQCTKECVRHGADYALIVKDEAYRLKASGKLKRELDTLAGREAQITGSEKDHVIRSPRSIPPNSRAERAALPRRQLPDQRWAARPPPNPRSGLQCRVRRQSISSPLVLFV